jgi:hypothetical protein
MWKLTQGYGYLLHLGAIVVFRILHLDLPWCMFIMSLCLWDWGVPPSPPFFLHALWSCVSTTHPKNNKPKSLPNNTWWKKTNNNQSNNLCHRHNYFGFVSFVASYYYIHAPNKPPGLVASHVWWPPHGWQQIEHLSSSLPTRFMWCESMGSNNGGSLNSHALEFRKCQHNMVGFFLNECV